MIVAGIDYTSYMIDVVFVDSDDDVTWFSYSIPSVGDWFERVREIPQVLPARRSVFWGGTTAIGLERPMGPNRGTLLPVLGAILACLPSGALIEPLMPNRWRNLVGLSGRAKKGEVAVFADEWRMTHGTRPNTDEWPQDPKDALCMALAVRSLVEAGTVRA